MDRQLLVRVYNVGLGDCIYLRVPDLNRYVHIMIDCGNKFGTLELLGERIADLKRELPDADAGKKHLDLLVVTQPNEDHNKGFEEEFFGDLQIDRIWLSPAFNRLDPKAQAFHALQDAVQRALLILSETATGEMKEWVFELLSMSKAEAIEIICDTLPHMNGIQPLYASADTPQEQLKVFADPAIQLKVLGPMSDIDSYYVGEDGLLNLQGGLASQELADRFQAMFPSRVSVEVKPARNISAQDFKQLRGRFHANSLLWVEIVGHIVNNMSVVLLLEWHGRRLLFPGDAEWDGDYGGEVKRGHCNGSWNVMWQERRADLSHPLDFLMLGYHGSSIATPWTPPDPYTGKEHPINQILESLLPKPQGSQTPNAKAVVSTLRTSRWPSIPDAELMEEIGKRIANATTQYVEDPSRTHVPAGVPQPQRTDLEEKVAGMPVPFIEIRFQPG